MRRAFPHNFYPLGLGVIAIPTLISLITLSIFLSSITLEIYFPHPWRFLYGIIGPIAFFSLIAIMLRLLPNPDREILEHFHKVSHPPKGYVTPCGRLLFLEYEGDGDGDGEGVPPSDSWVDVNIMIPRLINDFVVFWCEWAGMDRDDFYYGALMLGLEETFLKKDIYSLWKEVKLKYIV